MIISHKHKFIFIKTEKTAGTSIEIALSEICGPEDIITAISPEDEKYRKELGFRTKQNYLIPFSKYSKRDFFDFISSRKRLKFFNHIGAVEIKRLISKEQWNEYFKFTFERNPFDKLISYYYWRGGEELYPTVMDFIKSDKAAKIKGFELYTENSKIEVDAIYKYEKLAEALLDLSEKLDLKKSLTLPEKRAKGNKRKNKGSYQSILSEEEREWAEKVFARELAFHNYSF